MCLCVRALAHRCVCVSDRQRERERERTHVDPGSRKVGQAWLPQEELLITRHCHHTGLRHHLGYHPNRSAVQGIVIVLSVLFQFGGKTKRAGVRIRINEGARKMTRSTLQRKWTHDERRDDGQREGDMPALGRLQPEGTPDEGWSEFPLLGEHREILGDPEVKEKFLNGLCMRRQRRRILGPLLPLPPPAGIGLNSTGRRHGTESFAYLEQGIKDGRRKKNRPFQPI